MKKKNVILLIAGITVLAMVFGLEAYAGRYGMGMYDQAYGYGMRPGKGRGMGMNSQYGPAPGYGRGQGMVGRYGARPGYGYARGNCPGFAGSSLSDEEIQRLEEQRAAFFKETEPLRNDIYQKRLELRSELAKENPDIEKARKLQAEISGIRSQLDQKRMDHMIALKKINPNAGRGFMGQGPGRKGFGRGQRMW